MNDQVDTTVDPDQELLDMLGQPEEGQVENDEQAEVEATPDDVTAEQETAAEDDAEPVYRVTVKNEAGEDEERDVPVAELAKGYMLQADYTRKTQAAADEAKRAREEAQSSVRKTHDAAIERLEQIQAFVMRQAAPELNGVDWLTLASSDPAEFVKLQAKQQALQQTLATLDQQRSQYVQQRDQQIEQSVEQALRESDAVLQREIKDIDSTKVSQILSDVEKHVGWKASDLREAAKALTLHGFPGDTVGKMLLLAKDAISYRTLQAKKPEAVKKVAQAPRVIKPSAPQPRRTNAAATDRLKKFGRAEDLAALIPD